MLKASFKLGLRPPRPTKKTYKNLPLVLTIAVAGKTSETHTPRCPHVQLNLKRVSLPKILSDACLSDECKTLVLELAIFAPIGLIRTDRATCSPYSL